ncbi:hypothetical protein BX265_4725 [Streptomyces sp. TLI_235]|nr:hypothetical protein BX265_4725 [Streptomyces sp. TLI_235]
MGVLWWGAKALSTTSREPSPAPASAAERMVEALLEERKGYAARGLADRVAQVDEQLALRGYKPLRERSGK